MILITVGTEKFPFNRLMQWLESLIDSKFIDLEKEEVVIQYGSCTILPQGTTCHSLLPETDFKKLLQAARLIIAHCGEGTLDIIAATNKPFILIPRSHQFGEHVDDHQIELAEMLGESGIPIAYSPGDLAKFIQSPKAAKLVANPTGYYAIASQLLEAEFSANLPAQVKPGFAPTNWWQNLSYLHKAFDWIAPIFSV